MEWQGRRESENVEDRRGLSGRGVAAGGGVATIIVALLVFFLRGDPKPLLQELGQQGGRNPVAQGKRDAAEDELKKFVSVVLADTEDVWNELFKKHLNRNYKEPRLVLFSGKVDSACGFASAAVGPFYCPADERVYIDLSFFRQLRDKYGAPGDFAVAYVVAHEIGHHVQKLLGYTDRVHGEKSRVSETEGNQLSVRLELQADYLAGIWAHHAQRTKNILHKGDLEEAMGAAQAVGDDRLQMRGRGYVVPDSFTHGTSAQRVRWFRRGFDGGDFSRAKELFSIPYQKL